MPAKKKENNNIKQFITVVGVYIHVYIYTRPNPFNKTKIKNPSPEKKCLSKCPLDIASLTSSTFLRDNI